MLRNLAIRNFVLVDALDVEFGAGFAVLTGETGAGKSILVDALALLLGDRFEPGQLRAGAQRAELAAAFATGDEPGVAAWLVEHELAGDADEVLLRRVLDAQGRSRAFVNGHPVTLAQLAELGERLVDIFGQNAHQSLGQAAAQRALVDGFGGFAILARETADAWRKWRVAVERRDAAQSAARASAAEVEFLRERQRELSDLDVSAEEWEALNATQSRLANAASLIAAAGEGEALLAESDDAIATRLAQLVQRLEAAAEHDAALREVVALLVPAAIQVDEAARMLREYRRRLDLDPGELARVEERIAAVHDVARKHRVKAEALPALLAETEARIATLHASADASGLARAAQRAEADYRALAETLSHKRSLAAMELTHRVTEAMQSLAMDGGRFEAAVVPLAEPASFGLESVEFRVATHPKQPSGPLARVASGGELSRIALAIQVVASEVGDTGTLVFDEVDAGIGGAVAATVGRLMQSLGSRRQVLCVTHLPQVAAFADAHFRVTKDGDGDAVTSRVERLSRAQRLEELARMLGGSEVTAKTRAHAKELYEQHRRAQEK
ncbi:MAG: DNA repair protein RecN [Betaproteobacteria bacterium]|jgi:DNA repair protein RecN (Recombination protein N)|nr:DNA repair protein RecN [Betaproteobacteria bacterium]MDH5286995.1 DNA repair protein RecN [Betaproteobacteria bacterium]